MMRSPASSFSLSRASRARGRGHPGWRRRRRRRARRPPRRRPRRSRSRRPRSWGCSCARGRRRRRGFVAGGELAAVRPPASSTACFMTFSAMRFIRSQVADTLTASAAFPPRRPTCAPCRPRWQPRSTTGLDRIDAVPGVELGPHAHDGAAVVAQPQHRLDARQLARVLALVVAHLPRGQPHRVLAAVARAALVGVAGGVVGRHFELARVVRAREADEAAACCLVGLHPDHLLGQHAPLLGERERVARALRTLRGLGLLLARAALVVVARAARAHPPAVRRRGARRGGDRARGRLGLRRLRRF